MVRPRDVALCLADAIRRRTAIRFFGISQQREIEVRYVDPPDFVAGGGSSLAVARGQRVVKPRL